MKNLKHIKLFENFLNENVDVYFEASKNKKPLLVYFKYDKNKPDTDNWNIGRILLSDVERTGTWKNGKSVYSGKCDSTNNKIIIDGKSESVQLQGIDQDTKVGEEFQISMVKDGKSVLVDNVFLLMITNDKNVKFEPNQDK
jgi:hypothetical protein